LPRPLDGNSIDLLPPQPDPGASLAADCRPTIARLSPLLSTPTRPPRRLVSGLPQKPAQ